MSCAVSAEFLHFILLRAFLSPCTSSQKDDLQLCIHITANKNQNKAFLDVCIVSALTSEHRGRPDALELLTGTLQILVASGQCFLKDLVQLHNTGFSPKFHLFQ